MDVIYYKLLKITTHVLNPELPSTHTKPIVISYRQIVVYMELRRLEFREWDKYLPNQSSWLFHGTDVLRVIDEYTSENMLLLGGFKGQEPVGLIPVFISQKFGFRLVSSPPLGLGLGRLGPIIMSTSPKQRKIESAYKSFNKKVLSSVNAESSNTLFRMTCLRRFKDPRAYSWSGFNVSPAFTYTVDLESRSAENVLKSFSRDLRKDIRNREKAGISIRVDNDRESLGEIYHSMQSRFREQGLEHPMSWEFFNDLIEALDDRTRVYVAESASGKFISGMVILYTDDGAYNWKGGAKPSNITSSVSPNNLLHWRIIEDIIADDSLPSIDHYDLYTANNERLSEYKSSFNGDLTPYYIVETDSIRLDLAKRLYELAKHPRIPINPRYLTSKN